MKLGSFLALMMCGFIVSFLLDSNRNSLRLVSHINVTNYYKEVRLSRGIQKGDTVIINTMPFIVQD